MNNTMRAARLVTPGKPFEIDSVSVPELRAGDVLVRVKACGVVPNMNAVVSGQHWYILPPLPAVYGLDAAGVVESVGAGVTGFAPGDRVFVNPILTCGSCHYCRLGQQALCPSFTLRGYFGTGPESVALMTRYPYGGFSEYTVAPPSSLVRLPDNVSFELGARLGYLGTSYAALKRAGVGPGRSVLVNGITGTLGVGATMLALAMGATRILGTGRKAEVLSRLETLGRGRVKTFALGAGSLEEWARSETGGLGVDAMIDVQGRAASIDTVHEAIRGIRRGGTAVTVGAVEGKIAFDYVWFFITGITLTGSLWFTTPEGEEMMEMARAGTLDLSALEHRTFPLDAVNDALALAATSPGGFTNVVVQI